MPNPNPKGIDIETALSILSERTQKKDGRDDNSDHSAGCGCHHPGESIPESMKTMGQTIDLNQGDGESGNTHTDEERRKEEEKIKDERAERQEEIKKQLQSMSNKELLQSVLNAQEERVATYRAYERCGLY